MALRNRTFFFDPANTDRFNSQDIPTEATMRDWCDSVPFIKEIADRAQIGRAGIAKTTSDANINNGVNTDQSGVSPAGFTTFVRPSQLPVILDSADVTWTKVPRGGADTGDTGIGIEDYSATVNFPTIVVPENTNDIELVNSYEIFQNDLPICSGGQTSTIISSGSDLTALLTALETANQNLSDAMAQVSALACNANDGSVEIGDVIMSYRDPNTWGPSWLEPNGDLLLIASYPDLFANIGNTYGGDGIVNFRLPDLTSDSNYLRTKPAAGIIPLADVDGGTQSYTLAANDIPQHSHTLTGNTSEEGDHYHQITVSPTDWFAPGFSTGNIYAVTGPPPNYTSATDGPRTVDSGITKPIYSDLTTGDNTTGNHYHTLSGTTGNYGASPNDPVWNMASGSNRTPAFTNVYLKMRVK